MTESGVGSNSVREAFLLCRQSFVSVMVFSFFINALMLTPMFYMINVFDKAVSTGSLSTLFSLAVMLFSCTSCWAFRVDPLTSVNSCGMPS